jgi:hypothetical protein
LIITGPNVTMNNDGMRKNTSGKTILAGARRAICSARCRRFVRIC